jgi:choline kinase
MSYKVLIPTSGVGSRLGDFTKNTNKSLVRIGDAPSITRVLQHYPKDCTFVITLGHYGDHVRQYLEIAHPELKFEFIEVVNYKGPGSSLGHSILHAKDVLQEPFVYNACDALLMNSKHPHPIQNKIYGNERPSSNYYDSFITSGEKVSSMHFKGAMHSKMAYIGVADIKDYEIFWNRLEELYNSKPEDSSLNDFAVLKSLLESFEFELYGCSTNNWHDMGNVQSLKEARKAYGSTAHVLDKPAESIYLLDDCVVKFFHDESIVAQRVSRVKWLTDKVPQLQDVKTNFYRYKKEPGELMSDNTRTLTFLNLLNWGQKELWIPEEAPLNYKEQCADFYQNKTFDRIQKFISANPAQKMSSQIKTINGVKNEDINDLLMKIDWDWINDGIYCPYFHGDFILDNILHQKGNFKLLDWRQNFAGSVNSGDVYYDLAKLNHNLVLTHSLMEEERFTLKTDGSDMVLDTDRKHSMVIMQQHYHQWIQDNGYDLKKVKVLTGIIWLNMAPLHDLAFSQFLWYFGKHHLSIILNEDNSI